MHTHTQSCTANFSTGHYHLQYYKHPLIKFVSLIWSQETNTHTYYKYTYITCFLHMHVHTQITTTTPQAKLYSFMDNINKHGYLLSDSFYQYCTYYAMDILQGSQHLVPCVRVSDCEALRHHNSRVYTYRNGENYHDYCIIPTFSINKLCKIL